MSPRRKRAPLPKPPPGPTVDDLNLGSYIAPLVRAARMLREHGAAARKRAELVQAELDEADAKRVDELRRALERTHG